MGIAGHARRGAGAGDGWRENRKLDNANVRIAVAVARGLWLVVRGLFAAQRPSRYGLPFCRRFRVLRLLPG